MSFVIRALLVAVGIVACTPTPSPTPTPASGAARLNVSGSGALCGPWWFGCGAILVVEAPGWTLPENWAPSPEDTRFAIEFSRNMEQTRVRGITQVAQDRIEPGHHRLVVIKTESPDTATDGSFEASVLCSIEVDVPPGTRAVNVEVTFATGCAIEVSLESRF